MEYVICPVCFPPATGTPPPPSPKATATSPAYPQAAQLPSSPMVSAIRPATLQFVPGMQGTAECVLQAVSDI